MNEFENQNTADEHVSETINMDELMPFYEKEFLAQKKGLSNHVNHFFMKGFHMDEAAFRELLDEAYDLEFLGGTLVDTFIKFRDVSNEFDMLNRYYDLLIMVNTYNDQIFRSSVSYLIETLTESERLFKIARDGMYMSIDFVALSRTILKKYDIENNSNYVILFEEMAEFNRNDTVSLANSIPPEAFTQISEIMSRLFNPDKNAKKQEEHPAQIFAETQTPENIAIAKAREESNPHLMKVFDMDDLKSIEGHALLPKIVEKTNLRKMHRVDSFLDNLDDLRQDFPNMTDFIDSVEGACMLNKLGDGAFHIPPTLLIGPPGIGKTFFLSVLLEKAKVHKTMVHMESLSGGWMLTGASGQWKDAKAGVIFNNIIDSEYANNAIVLDEIDKITKGSHSPENTLLQVFEEHTAKEFKDEFCPLKLDISKLTWFATANELANISAPMLSRFSVYNIKMPTLAERKILAANIYKYLLSSKSWGHAFSPVVSQTVLDKICEMEGSIRTMKSDLLNACGKAAKNGRTELRLEDFNQSTAAIQTKIGFCS